MKSIAEGRVWRLQPSVRLRPCVLGQCYVYSGVGLHNSCKPTNSKLYQESDR
jgi:hypothetical protein